jgi:glycosyltransferase involved in cell wall biosynthesis
MTDTPRVTLGVTTFNTERYLPGALDAALAQDFRDFEMVICDNGSTDRTWEIIQAYAARDPRVRAYRNETNLGYAGNFARVVSLARGEFFRLTAHDDLMAPTLLSSCVAALDANPTAVLAYPQGTLIDLDGNEILRCEGEPDIRAASPARRIVDVMRALSFCNSMFGVIRLDALRRTRLIGQFGASDNRLLIELAARGPFVLVPERLFFRRAPEDGTFGGAATVKERYEWLEPAVASKRRFRRSSGMEVPLVTRVTFAALARNDLPLRVRLSTTATFCVIWPTRLTRIELGRWRRRLLSRPATPSLTGAGQ